MNRFALLVGSDEYEDPNIRSLQYAVHDVMDMAHLLERDCGFAEVRAIRGREATGKGTPSSEEATGAPLPPSWTERPCS